MGIIDGKAPTRIRHQKMFSFLVVTFLSSHAAVSVSESQIQLWFQRFNGNLTPCHVVDTSTSHAWCALTCASVAGCVGYNYNQVKDGVEICEVCQLSQMISLSTADDVPAHSAFLAWDNRYFFPGPADWSQCALLFPDGLRDGMIITLSGLFVGETAGFYFTDTEDKSNNVPKKYDLFIDIRFVDYTSRQNTMVFDNFDSSKGGWLMNTLFYTTADYFTKDERFSIVVMVKESEYTLYFLGRGVIVFKSICDIELSEVRYMMATKALFNLEVTSCCDQVI